MEIDRTAREAQAFRRLYQAVVEQTPTAPDLEEILLGDVSASRRRGWSTHPLVAFAAAAGVVLVTFGSWALFIAEPPAVEQPLEVIDGTEIGEGEEATEREEANDQVRWWRTDLGAGGVASGGWFVTINEEAVFTVGGDGFGYINAVSLDDGTDLWRMQLHPGGGVHVQLATEDLVVANPQFEELVALGAADGERVWTFTAPDGYGFVSSTLHGDLLVAVAGTPVASDTRPPIVYGINLPTGQLRWTTLLRESEEPQCMRPVVAGNAVIVYTVPDGDPERSAVHALELADGGLRWTTDVGEPRSIPACMKAALHATEAHVHVPLIEGGSVTLAVDDGRLLWESDMMPAGSKGEHLLMRDSDRVVRVDPGTGQITHEGSQIPGTDMNLRTFVAADNQIVVVSLVTVAFIDPATGTLTNEVALPAPVNEKIIVLGDRIVVSSLDQGVFVLSTR